jgi:hypothetical protein
LCSFCCLTFLASNLEATEKNQKIAKKQNTAHPSDPNMLGSHFSEANYGPKNNLEKEPPTILPINRGG